MARDCKGNAFSINAKSFYRFFVFSDAAIPRSSARYSIEFFRTIRPPVRSLTRFLVCVLTRNPSLFDATLAHWRLNKDLNLGPHD